MGEGSNETEKVTSWWCGKGLGFVFANLSERECRNPSGKTREPRDLDDGRPFFIAVEGPEAEKNAVYNSGSFLGAALGGALVFAVFRLRHYRRRTMDAGLCSIHHLP